MRRVSLNLKIALRSLSLFKLRTILAVFGVFLGTLSLVVVSNVSRSLAKKTEVEISRLGENLLIVRSGIVRRFASGTRLLSEATTLTPEDAIALVHGSHLVKDVSPSSNKSFPIRYGTVSLSPLLVTGTSPNYSEVRNFMVQDGRFISEDDNAQLNKVAVLGKRVAEKLFIDEYPIGKYILIFRVPCQVIGIMEEKGVDISGVDQDNQIFVPLNTFMRKFVNKTFINSIQVKVVDKQSIPLAKSQIEDILRKRHKIRGEKKDDFTVIDLKDVLALQEQAAQMITVLGRIAAAVSFSIGGIGILSIMILIVNERKIEIGIRRAVGSRRKDIILQFLMESSFISFMGGSIGVVAGLLITAVIVLVLALPLVISLAGFAASFLASVTIGILAGIYPSRKATTIQPVDILKS